MKHLWCNEDKASQSALRETLLSGTGLSGQGGLWGRMERELSECLNCVQEMHVFFDTRLDDVDDPQAFAIASQQLERLNCLRVTKNLHVDERRIREEQRMPLHVSNAITEALNYSDLLQQHCLFAALEAYLDVVLQDSRTALNMHSKCSGLLLLCASAVDRVRRWAMELVVKLGLLAQEDDVKFVLVPALDVLMSALRDHRVAGDSTLILAPNGLVVFRMPLFQACIWHIMSLVPSDALHRLARDESAVGLFLDVLIFTVRRVDDNVMMEDVKSLSALAELLSACPVHAWELMEERTPSLVFDEAADVLFTKLCSTYQPLTKKTLASLLLCLRSICLCAPLEKRVAVQDQTIQFLLCEFPFLTQNTEYTLEANRSAVLIVGASCKAGILPVDSETIWGPVMVSLSSTEPASARVLSWVLKQCDSEKGPLFPATWQAVLSSRASLPEAVHISVWKSQSKWSLASSSPKIDTIRQLLGAYINERVPPLATWLPTVAREVFPPMVCVNSAVAVAARKIFSERVCATQELLRACLDGATDFLSRWERSRPQFVSLVCNALNTVVKAASVANMSLTAFGNFLAEFLYKFRTSNVSGNGARAAAKLIISLEPRCTADHRYHLAAAADAFLRSKDLTPEEVSKLRATLPQVSAHAVVSESGRIIPASFGKLGKGAKSTLPELAAAGGGNAAPRRSVLPLDSLKDRDAAITSKAAAAAAAAGKTSLNQAGAKRAVLPVGEAVRSPSSISASAERRAAMDAELKTQRLLPSLVSLQSRVLAWSLEDLLAGKQDESLELLSIPDTFDSADHYRRVFEPLLLAEVHATIVRDIEESGDDEVLLPLHLGDVKRRDPFMALTVRVEAKPGEEVPKNAMRDKFSVDDLIEMRAPSGATLLALVEKLEYDKRERREVAYLLTAPGVKQRVDWVPSWKCRRLSSILTAGREFRSMLSLKHLPLRDLVLKGKFTGALPPLLGGSNPNGSGSTVSQGSMPKLLSRKFNPSQVAAIEQCLKTNHGFVLIQGPPGTGKTATVLGMIASILLRDKDMFAPGPASATTKRRKRVLVCAASNRAVDEVASRLLGGVWDPYHDRKEELKVVRVGREAATSEAVRHVMVDVLAEEKCKGRLSRSDQVSKESSESVQRLQQKLSDLEQELSKLLSSQASMAQLRTSSDGIAPGPTPEEGNNSQKVRELLSQKRDVRANLKKAQEKRSEAQASKAFDLQAARDEVIRLADVVCATLSASGSEALLRLDLEFDAVIVDEAAQATELESLIPLKYRSKLCIMVGDPKQLPATVMSKAAAQKMLHQGLFQRLQRLKMPVTLLDVQYRMHPKVCAFPNATFYDGLLKNGPNVLLPTYAKPYHNVAAFRPFVFVDVRGSESRGRSVMNVDEASLAVRLVQHLAKHYGKEFREGSVGVITPYRRQMLELRDRLNSVEELKRLVDVNTVDGFQGAEKDVVIFSCVRSHAERSGIGFLEDVRRLNVAITRARFSLVVLGNASLLSEHETYRALVQHAQNTFVLIRAADVEEAFRGEVARRYELDLSKIKTIKSAAPKPASAAPPTATVPSSTSAELSSMPSSVRLAPAVSMHAVTRPGPKSSKPPASPPSTKAPVKPAPSSKPAFSSSFSSSLGSSSKPVSAPAPAPPPKAEVIVDIDHTKARRPQLSIPMIDHSRDPRRAPAANDTTAGGEAGDLNAIAPNPTDGGEPLVKKQRPDAETLGSMFISAQPDPVEKEIRLNAAHGAPSPGGAEKPRKRVKMLDE